MLEKNSKLKARRRTYKQIPITNTKEQIVDIYDHLGKVFPSAKLCSKHTYKNSLQFYAADNNITQTH